MGVLDVVLETAVESVIKNAVIERVIRLCGLFPFQVRVGITLRSHAGNRLIAEGVARTAVCSEKDQGRIRRDRWVTLLSPSSTQSKLAEWPTAHEAFLAQAPRTGDCREGRPLVIGTELRGSVLSDYESEEILLEQSRVRPSEERNDAAIGLECIRRLEGVAAAKTVEG